MLAEPVTPYQRFVLLYSPAWMLVVALLMITSAMSSWTDPQYLALGLSLALPPWLAALALPSERGLRWSAREGVRFQVVNGITVLLQSALGTQLFFHRLGMEYRFPVRLSLLGTPVFLYLLTIAYFSTYYVAMTLALRLGRGAWPGAPRWLAVLGRAGLCFAVAFGETWFMATPAMRPWFGYRDVGFMLSVGSLCYGTLFALTLPAYERLYDRPPPSLARAAGGALAKNAMALAAYLGFALVLRPR